jgi:hypothetical protein
VHQIILDSNNRRKISESNTGVRNSEKETLNLEPYIDSRRSGVIYFKEDQVRC